MWDWRGCAGMGAGLCAGLHTRLDVEHLIRPERGIGIHPALTDRADGHDIDEQEPLPPLAPGENKPRPLEDADMLEDRDIAHREVRCEGGDMHAGPLNEQIEHAAPIGARQRRKERVGLCGGGGGGG
jgi:hypothetical protein